jgi:hypothetical protein
MLETHIVMSSFIFRLVLTLVLRLVLLHALFRSSLMDLTIAHIVLDHERTALSLDALVMAYILIMVIIFHVVLVFLHEGFIFPVVVLVPLIQTVMYKRLLRLLLVVWLSTRFLRFISLTPALSHRLFLVLCR